eukprot:5207392-Alexandrium_andersonii.AAC.1
MTVLGVPEEGGLAERAMEETVAVLEEEGESEELREVEDNVGELREVEGRAVNEIEAACATLKERE